MIKKNIYLVVFSCSFLQGELVQRADFFKEVMGIGEVEFQKNYNQDPDIYILHNKKKGQTLESFQILANMFELLNAGFFKELSISDLRAMSQKMQKPVGGTFHVIEAVNPPGQSYLKKVDVGAMQADPDYKDAVFQVASNFNALELVGPNDQMENITKYLNDKTQGPFASLSALPGLIYRHYYMFYKKKPQGQWKQTPQRQINFLDQTDIPVTNSYVDFTKKAPDKVQKYKVEDIKVGYHRDIQVTFGFMPDFTKFEKVTNPDQIVNQVFTAAVDFGSNFTYKTDKKAIEIAQAIQDAAYEGTIRAAFVHGKKKVVLTMIGGGVFANDIAWIANAIEKNKQLIQQSGMKVELVIFNSANYATTDMNSFRDRMLNIVHDTGGTYTQYSPQNSAGVDLAKKVQTSPLQTALTNLKDSLTNLTSALQTR